MRIAVFGLGYVGTVCGTCLAHQGHSVVGFDINQEKVESINRGRSVIHETGLDDLLRKVIHHGHMKATSCSAEALRDAEIILICVGTPASANGTADISQIQSCIRIISQGLYLTAEYPVIVLRSTAPPGTLKHCATFMEETSGMIHEFDFGIVSNPEFLREGTAILDFEYPPYILMDNADPRSLAKMRELYKHIHAPFVTASTGATEIHKYINNSWHALKVAFANEIGSVCKSIGVDGYEAMELFCTDTKLNISDAYLKPGSAYGGSCLPKDLKALCQIAHSNRLDTPLLQQIEKSNNAHIERSVELIEAFGHRKIAFLGLTFKTGTGDLRLSPTITIVKTLIKLGYEVRVYDPRITASPGLSTITMSSADDILTFGETIVLTQNDPVFQSVATRIESPQTLFDMTRLPEWETLGRNYQGICW